MRPGERGGATHPVLTMRVSELVSPWSPPVGRVQPSSPPQLLLRLASSCPLFCCSSPSPYLTEPLPLRHMAPAVWLALSCSLELRCTFLAQQRHCSSLPGWHDHGLCASWFAFLSGIGMSLSWVLCLDGQHLGEGRH